MRYMRYLMFITILLTSGALKAQVSFSFIPEVQGRTVDGLFLVRIIQAETQRRTVRMVITVTERTAGRVATVQTQSFDLLPGGNPLPGGVARQASIQFSDNRTGAVTRQSGYFLEGDYDYCFQLFEGKAGGVLLAEQCFQYFLQPFSPLMLIKPADGDVLCDKRPAFFWQPLLPNIPGVQYRLAMVALKAGQHKVEGMNVNLPLINQRNINTPMLFYPAGNRELEEGKKYAWQVTAYKGTTMLAQSEIWEFSCNCSNQEKDSIPEAFRDIEDLAKGNFYVAEGKIMFAMRNPYSEMNLSYTILPVTDPAEKIRKLKKIRLQRGMNHIVIDLRDNHTMKDGHYYQLQVKLPGGDSRILRFLYKQPLEP